MSSSFPTQDKRTSLPYARLTASQLQTEFSQLKEEELEKIITAYGYLLPYTWDHPHLYRLDNNDLKELFHERLITVHPRTRYTEKICQASLDMNTSAESNEDQSSDDHDSDEEKLNETPSTTLSMIRQIEKGPYFPVQRYKYLSNVFGGWNSAWNLKYGQPLVFDCCYRDYMSYSEWKSFHSQLHQCVDMNATSPNGFNIILANVPEATDDTNTERFDGFTDDSLRYNCTSKSVTELFPKEDLIMLSPHSSYIMDKFEADKIYIIGGFVDMGRHPLQSTARSDQRASEFGIKCYQFPIDSYFRWGSGSKKELTLNAALRVLIELRNHGDWKRAFNAALPDRFKFRSEQDIQLNKNIKRTKTEMLHRLTSRTVQRQTENKNRQKSNSFNYHKILQSDIQRINNNPKSSRKRY